MWALRSQRLPARHARIHTIPWVLELPRRDPQAEQDPLSPVMLFRTGGFCATLESPLHESPACPSKIEALEERGK